MIAAALLGLSLAVSTTYEPEDLAPNAQARAVSQMSPRQKLAALRPLIRSATDCVVRTIEADPRFRRASAPADMNELIVASMEPCAEAMRGMIDAHDRLFGEGSGEAFFMGPYLDGLPVTIDKLVKGAAYDPKPVTE
ncbi:MAG TPA: hypothetical protein VK456_17250 [Xanthobacteraceae bacterium]|nr:hypothetical protein [Xanthobacteraceae bacterium]